MREETRNATIGILLGAVLIFSSRFVQADSRMQELITAGQKIQAAELLRHLETLALDDESRLLKGITPWWRDHAFRNGGVLLIEARQLPIPGKKRERMVGIKADPSYPWLTVAFVAKKPVSSDVQAKVRSLVVMHGGVYERVPVWTPGEFIRLSGASAVDSEFELEKVNRDLKGNEALIYRLLPDLGTE